MKERIFVDRKMKIRVFKMLKPDSIGSIAFGKVCFNFFGKLLYIGS